MGQEKNHVCRICPNTIPPERIARGYYATCSTACAKVNSQNNFKRLHAEDRAQRAERKLDKWCHVVAYLLDRADQYETQSPCWIALADAAENIMNGAVDKAVKHGEFDDELYARVFKMKAKHE